LDYDYDYDYDYDFDNVGDGGSAMGKLKKTSAEKAKELQEEYEIRNNVPDPLGLAVQQVFSRGISFDYPWNVTDAEMERDNYTLSEKIWIYYSRCARSAVRHMYCLYDQDIDSPELRGMTGPQKRSYVDSEKVRIGEDLLMLVCSEIGGPRGCDDIKVRFLKVGEEVGESKRITSGSAGARRYVVEKIDPNEPINPWSDRPDGEPMYIGPDWEMLERQEREMEQLLLERRNASEKDVLRGLVDRIILRMILREAKKNKKEEEKGQPKLGRLRRRFSMSKKDRDAIEDQNIIESRQAVGDHEAVEDLEDVGILEEDENIAEKVKIDPSFLERLREEAERTDKEESDDDDDDIYYA